MDIHIIKKVKELDENSYFCFYNIADDLVSPCKTFKSDKLTEVSGARKILHNFQIWQELQKEAKKLITLKKVTNDNLFSAITYKKRKLAKTKTFGDLIKKPKEHEYPIFDFKFSKIAKSLNPTPIILNSIIETKVTWKMDFQVVVDLLISQEAKKTPIFKEISKSENLVFSLEIENASFTFKSILKVADCEYRLYGALVKTSEGFTHCELDNTGLNFVSSNLA